MALGKTVEVATGAQAMYWKIIYIDADLLYETIRVRLAGFLNKAARQARKDPLEIELYIWPLSDFGDIETMLIRTCYEKIKEMIEWSDAKDI